MGLLSRFLKGLPAHREAEKRRAILEEMRGDLRYLRAMADDRAMRADPRYADARARVTNRDELMAALRPIFETKTSDEWVELLSSIDILKAKVNTYEDLFADPQVQAIDAVHWIENDTLGRVPMGTLCGQPRPATGAPLTHAPHVGEHTREILAEMGYGAGDIDKLKASGVVGCYGA